VPNIKAFVYVTDDSYSIEDLILIEGEIISTLQFNINISSRLDFFNFYKNWITLDN